MAAKENEPASLKERQEHAELYTKIFSRTYLNFELQSFLQQDEPELSDKAKQQFQTIGYKGEFPLNFSKEKRASLFAEEEFFSYTQTGRRIVSYALKENGMNPGRFEQIENAINDAYKDVKSKRGEHPLLEETYLYSLATLNVFKP